MYRPWKPLGKIARSDWPGFELMIKGRSLTVNRYVWREGICISGMSLNFRDSVAGFYLIDESVEVTSNYSPLPQEFDDSDAACHGCEMWVEENSTRLELYGELGKENYGALNSYYMVGQEVVLVVDAETEPTVTELPATSLPVWE